ncbi:MAG: hypothetical protein ACR2NZ_14375 [Rubripirellula sp.]
MTSKEANARDKRTIYSIKSVFRVNTFLRQCIGAVQISIESSTIVLRGELPSSTHKAQLIPAIRQAGVLARICDQVRIPA